MTIKNLVMKEFFALIQRHLEARNWTFDDLFLAIAPKHPLVAKRKINLLFTGAEYRRGVIESICKALDIGSQEKEEALALDWMERHRIEGERQRPYFTPHIWVEVTSAWRPSLLSITGPNIYRRIAAPEALIALENDDEIIKAASKFLSDYYHSDVWKVAQITHYLYRRKIDLIYRFTPQGEFVEKVEELYLTPISRVAV